MAHVMDINGEEWEETLLEHIDQNDEWLATTAEICENVDEDISEDEFEGLIREAIQSELDSYTDMIIEHLKEKLKAKYIPNREFT